MPLTEDDLKTVQALIDARLEPIRVHREEHDALKSGLVELQREVAHLAQVVEENGRQQAETSRHLRELAQAQRRTEKALTEQGKRIEEQGKRIEEQGKRIEEQGKRIEKQGERHDALVQRVDAGFQRMEEGFERFGRRMTELSQNVGALSEAYGLDLEDIGRYVIPRFLMWEEGYEVGPLEPRYFRLQDKEEEVDLFGEARKAGKTFIVVAETKSRVHIGEMRTLLRRNSAIAQAEGKAVLSVLLARRIHPEALELARTEGMILIPWDYQYSRECTRPL